MPPKVQSPSKQLLEAFGVKEKPKLKPAVPKKPKAKSHAVREKERMHREWPQFVQLLHDNPDERGSETFGHWVFCLPLPYNKGNGRLHHMAEARLKKLTVGFCSQTLPYRFNPKPPSVPMQKATVAATIVSKQGMDADNAKIRCKVLIDWLVKAGYLADDSSAHLSWDGDPGWQPAGDSVPRVVISLQEVHT